MQTERSARLKIKMHILGNDNVILVLQTLLIFSVNRFRGKRLINPKNLLDKHRYWRAYCSAWSIDLSTPLRIIPMFLNKIGGQRDMRDELIEELTEKEIADLAEKYGLSKPGSEPELLKNNLFQGDFGTSIPLSDLITTLILFSTVIFLIIYMKKKKKRSN
ncbi:hypothetical protein [Sporosarcina sp. YIM B06819]|uniref:hypothetical protein n=1 Tax=Sporosarcina sp. YIM B06819 TaxID=3081769 RepID=UPI00298BE95C|nr:hypothetical protein [Sporosarcina sp. YIM B06819]